MWRAVSVFGLTRSVLSDEFNFRISCIKVRRVTIERYKRRFCRSDVRSFVRLMLRSLFWRSSLSAEQRRRRVNIWAVIVLTAVCSGGECCASLFSSLLSSFSRARCRPVVNYSVFDDVCQSSHDGNTTGIAFIAFLCGSVGVVRLYNSTIAFAIT